MKTDFSFASHITKKYSLFHVLLATLIGGDSKVGWLEILFKVIAELQMVGMLLVLPFEFLDTSVSDTLGDFVKSISQILSFDNILVFDNNSILTGIFLGIVLAYIIVLLLYLVAFVVCHYLKYTIPANVIRVWINLCVIHFTFLFLYIQECSLGLIKSGSDDNAYLFGITTGKLFLWLGIVITVMNIIFGALTSKFVYEPIKSQYIAAIRTTTPDFLLIFAKALNVPFRLFITDLQAQKWLRLVLLVLTISYRVKIYLYSTPYYYFNPMRVFQGLVFIEFGMVLLNLIMAIIYEGKQVSGFEVIYMVLVLSIFFEKLSDVLLFGMIKKYGMKDINEIKDKDSFYKKLFATDYILEMGSISAIIEKKQREGVTEFLYYGVVKAHKNTCTKDICGCNLILEKGAMSEGVPLKEDQRRIMRDFKFELIADLFASFNHPEIKVTLANYLFENKVQAYAAAITIIHSLNLDQTTIELRVIRAKLLEKIEVKVLSNYDSSVDTQEIVDYQRLSYDLKKSIEKNLAKFISFWDMYRGAEPDISNLYKTSILINEEADEIAKIWSSIIGKYAKQAYQDHLLYGLYQSLVRSAPYSAEKVLQKFFSLSSIFATQKNKNAMITPDNVFEPQNILIYILMNKEQLGTVVFLTPNIESSLQYTAEEVLEKNVNTLMPGFYKERHNSILLAHIEKSRSSIINRNRSLFAQKKNGYVTPVTLYVSIFPYFQKQLIYIGILRPVQTFDEFLLVLPNGTIDGFSENIAHMLNLTSDKTRNYQMKSICKELESYMRAFEYLKAGDREKLRTIILSRKTHSTTSGKQTKPIHSDSSYSQSQKVTLTKKTTHLDGGAAEAEPIKDLFQDQEFDDWVRLYELFISTGVSIVFNRFVEKGAKLQKKGIEFNTIMIEENAYNSKMTIFRLQSVSAGVAEEDEEEEEQNFDEEEEHSREKSDTDKGLQPAMILETLKEKMKRKPDRTFTESKVEDAPGSMGALKTENLETEQEELLGAESKTPKSRLRNLVKKEAANLLSKKKQAENDEEFDVPDDNEAPPVNMEVMKNPLLVKLISSTLLQSQGSDRYLVEGRKDTPLLKPVYEKNEQPSPTLTPIEMDADLDQSPTNPGQLGLSSIRRQGSLGSGWRGDALEMGQRSLNVMKSMKERSVDTISSKKSSEREDQKEPEHKQKLKRFFHANKLLALDGGAGLNVDGQDRSSVSSSTKSARISSKVERAVYTNAVDMTIKALNVLVAIFCVAGIGMIIYYLVTANKNMNKLRSNVEVQRYSTQRLYLVVEINRRSRIIDIIARGLSPPDRTTSDDTASNLEALLPLADELSTYNNEIRLSINKIDKTEQQRFYELIPIKERGNPDSIRYINSFDTCTEIVNSVFRLTSLTTSPTADNPDLVFILENTLNDLILSNEDVANILLDDNQISLTRVETTILVLMILTVAIAICIFGFAVKSELQFIKRKTSFLDSFLRIKDYEIDSTLSIVNNFRTALRENNREDKFMQKIVDSNNNNQNVQSERNKKAENKKEHRSFKAKSASKRKLHNSSYINMGLVLGFVLAFTAIFAILLGIFLGYESSINKLMLRVINTNLTLYQMGLIFTSLYEYISEDGTTTIRNLPIGPEWERIYNSLTSSSEYFSSFDDQSAGFDDNVLALLSGNLCLTVFTDGTNCQNSLSYVATSGIMGINAFILKGLRSIKDLFDNWVGTLLQGQETALNSQDFLDVEVVYSLFTSDSYMALDTLLTNQFFMEIDEFLKRSLIMGLISIVGMVALGRVVWLQAVRRMEEERKAFRSILRVIPVNIIMGNRYLKSYLMRNSDRVLDSIKNKI